ncbi:MAG: hypothetical protein JXA61_06530, partial [Bacteroidales bacterium]|nr:hypothetical protein [Bacteroidales bacterium]
LGYLHPFYSKKKLDRKIRRCEKDKGIKSVCAQSLDLFSKEERERIFKWMDEVMERKLIKPLT